MVRRVCNARSRKKELIEGKNSSTIKNPTSETENKSERQSFKRKRVTSQTLAKVKLEGEVYLPATVEAHDVQLNLGTEYPSFTKSMSKSDVGCKRSQMLLPRSFCRLYLPNDENITLEDENNEKFEVKYASRWVKLTAGWKTFVASHKLREGDVLMCHLVERTKFKVYITRADDQVITVDPNLLEQNGQESSDLPKPFQELGTCEDSISKRVKLRSTGKVNLARTQTSIPSHASRKQNSAAKIQTNCIQFTKSPSFMKTIGPYKSMFIPRSFCYLHLPKEETMITLEDENGNQYEVKFVPTFMYLGAGWSYFIVSNNLCEGDVLHFHLIDPKKFKVYITRVDDHQATVYPSLIQQTEQGGSKSSSDPDDQSIDLGTFTEFQLNVRSLCVQSELDDDTLKKYYKLCCSKNDILHKKNLNGINSKLVAGIIGETVNIADSVKSCDIFTPREKLEQWEKTLESFKLLGMKVDFLIDLLSQLLKFRVKYEETGFASEIKNLEAKRLHLKEAYELVGCQIEKLKSEANKMHKVEFQQVIDSPW